MLTEFSIVPIGVGSSLSDKLAIVLKIIDESGITYRVNPMGTVVEGTWEETMDLIKKCRDALMETEERIIINIKIDDRKSKHNAIEEKIASVERKLGKTLKK
ncbi:MAG: MTH1187 family thiamine-binding protein [Thermodesulfovibrionales bacterium]|nr:MTH1187 family thiamine-binding protein [Thermodesulfovibrionales bacterium]